ncbi:MAG: HEXXH motif-containing putative peptide modification protein [Hyphomicrobium sp.]
MSIDANVRGRAAQSLAYIIDRCGSLLHIDNAEIALAIERIRDHRQPPGVFARYYDLIFAISRNDFDRASELIGEISNLSRQSVSFQILPFERATTGDDFDRYPHLLFAESPSVGPLAEPTAAEFEQAQANLRFALNTIRTIDPSIADDIDGLLTTIFVTKDARVDGSASFGGVTSFMIWGATFINLKAYRTKVGAVQFLVHEVTHALLFGLSCDAPLVLNPVKENYRSPLRKEPRPMDGIYHATLVCARLAAFNRHWLESGAENVEQIEEELNSALLAFQDGAHTIRSHGNLSETGRELIDRCSTTLA